MSILSELTNNYKINLLKLFNETDSTFEKVIDILIEKSFPNMQVFGYEFQHEIERFKEKINKIKTNPTEKKDEKNNRASQHLCKKLRKEFLATCKEIKECDIYKKQIDIHIDKYRRICQKFQDILFSRYQYLLAIDSDINTSVILVFEWMDYGLESLSSLSYLIINNIIHFVSGNSNANISYFNVFSNALSSAVVSFTNLDLTIIKSIFDINGYNDKLKVYANECHVPEGMTLDNCNSVFSLDFYKDKINCIQSDLKNLIPYDKLDIKHIIEEISLTDESFDSLKIIGCVYAESERIFIKNIFYEIKNFVMLLELNKILSNNNIKNIRGLIDSVASVYEENDLKGDIKKFFINKCHQWLNLVEKRSNQGFLYVLVQRYLKILSVYRLMEIEIPNISVISDMIEMLEMKNISNISDLTEFFKTMMIVKMQNDLNRVGNIRSRIYERYFKDNHLEPEPTPIFEGFMPCEKNILGGAQPKAAGSGFYTKNNLDREDNFSQEKFFLKRTTTLESLIDDLVETLTSDVCLALDFHSFAKCHPVRSQTTEDVFVASACRPGFEPLMDMSGRLSTRLMPKERKFIFELSEKMQDDLRKILFMCNLVADYDPNPGNLGKTSSGDIVKIDHGWAFDQICEEKIYTWHEILNPFRYPGRISPTNALCDYSKFLKKPDIEFIEQIVEKLSKPDSLKNQILQSLNSIEKTYVGSRALGSLKSKIELSDILKAFCKRFKLDYTKETDIECLSSRLSKVLYVRGHNLYFISLLESMAYFLKSIKSLPCPEQNNFVAQLDNQYKRMMKEKIPFCNMTVIKKLQSKIFSSVRRLETLLGEQDDMVRSYRYLFNEVINNNYNIEHVEDMDNMGKPILFSNNYNRGDKRHELDERTSSPSPKRKKEF